MDNFMKPKELFTLLTSIRDPEKFVSTLRKNKLTNEDDHEAQPVTATLPEYDE